MKKQIRVLIENDYIHSTCKEDLEYDQWGMFLNMYGLDDLTDFFDVIIDDASENKEKIIEAINNPDAQLWVDSCFVGSSGRLFVEMVNYVLANNITNKTLINLNKWTDIAWHFPEEIKQHISKLEENNIRFIYIDDPEFDHYGLSKKFKKK